MKDEKCVKHYQDLWHDEHAVAELAEVDTNGLDDITLKELKTK